MICFQKLHILSLGTRSTQILNCSHLKVWISKFMFDIYPWFISWSPTWGRMQDIKLRFVTAVFCRLAAQLDSINPGSLGCTWPLHHVSCGTFLWGTINCHIPPAYFHQAQKQLSIFVTHCSVFILLRNKSAVDSSPGNTALAPLPRALYSVSVQAKRPTFPM